MSEAALSFAPRESEGGYFMSRRVMRHAVLAVSATALVACGSAEQDNTPAAASTEVSTELEPTVTAPSTITPESSAADRNAEELRGDGQEEEFVFDYLDVGSDDIFVYDDPYESGRGPASFTYNDGERFYGDCTEIGRLVVSPNPQKQSDSDLWVLGRTQGGDRAFAPGVFLEGGPEEIRQRIEECN